METDPDFPDRPTHPDFKKLSDILVGINEMCSERNVGISELAQQFNLTDPDVINYVADMRFKMALMVTGSAFIGVGESQMRDLQATVMALWMEAYYYGFFMGRQDEQT